MDLYVFLCAFLCVDISAIRKFELAAGSVVVTAEVAMPDKAAADTAERKLKEADMGELKMQFKVPFKGQPEARGTGCSSAKSRPPTNSAKVTPG